MTAAAHTADQNRSIPTAMGLIDRCTLAEIREAVSASPLAANLLPRLMRTLADELEDASCAHLDVAASQPLASGDAEAVARRVAAGLSLALSCHLKGQHAPTVPGISGVPGVPGTSRNSPRVASTRLFRTSQGEVAAGRDEKSVAQHHLQLKLLGTPEITLDGVRLEAVERSTRLSLILYILALHRRGLSAECLGTYIASDSIDLDAFDTDAGMGVSTVRTFIWRLRKIVGWHGIVLSPGEHGGCQNRYRLPDGTTCDLWEFEHNLDEAARLAIRTGADRGTRHRAAALRQEAIHLYRGDFCKGVSSGCVSHAGEQLRNRYLTAVLKQAAYWKDQASRLRATRQGQRTAGEPPVEEKNAWLEALSNYRLAIQVEPYDEAAYLGAMQCQAYLGNSKGVQETLARCCRVINAELDRPPLVTTMQAAREYLELAKGSPFSILP